MFEFIARFAIRLRWVGAVILLATIVSGAVLASRTVAALQPGGFEVRDSRVSQNQDALSEHFGHPDVDLLLLVRDADGAPLNQGDRLAGLMQRLDEDSAVEQVIGPDRLPYTSGEQPSEAVLLVDVAGDDLEQQRRYAEIQGLVAEVEGLEVRIGGRLAANVEAQDMARSDLLRAEMIAMPLALVFLLLFFRKLLPAALPLVIGGFAVTSTLLTLLGVAQLIPISLFALNIVVFLGLGLAIDYSLFLVERFREELAVGNDVESSLTHTLVTAGKTVAFSGVAVMVSLLALAWVPIAMLRSMALAGALVVLLCNVGALLLLPCLLALFGRRLAKTVDPSDSERAAGSPRWGKLARLVLRRPGIVCAVVTGLLLVIGSPLLRIETATTDARVFPTETEIYQVSEVLADPERFEVDPSNAHMLMIEVARGQAVVSRTNLEALGEYAGSIAALDGVVEVKGLHEGLAQVDAGELAQVLADTSMLGAEAKAQLRRVLDGRTTVMIVLSELPAASPEARDQLDSILAAAPAELEVLASGRTAHAEELHAALGSRLPHAIVSVAVASFLVLLLAFGAPVVALKAVVVNTLSLCASFGALVFVFQDGRLEGLLGYESIGTVDPTVPVMMFALVFGLSMDYELFLLSRIREAHEHHGDNHSSVVEGLRKTGPIISTAALILIAVVASLVTGSLAFIKQLGLGMALAIFVDASLIRIALVPTVMVLLGRVNWWTPNWLARVRGFLGVDLREGEATLDERQQDQQPGGEIGDPAAASSLVKVG